MIVIVLLNGIDNISDNIDSYYMNDSNYDKNKNKKKQNQNNIVMTTQIYN